MDINMHLSLPEGKVANEYFCINLDLEDRSSFSNKSESVSTVLAQGCYNTDRLWAVRTSKEGTRLNDHSSLGLGFPIGEQRRGLPGPPLWD